MVKVNELLTRRFKKNKLSKMINLSEMSSSGELSSFSGVFRICALSENEQEQLRNLLSEFSRENLDVGADLKQLCAITSEVKAINNQAAILHGERIKRAQEILKKYRDGAFSTWLINTYGNRQTPYNFLQYYELYINIPKILQDKVDEMPRQAVYTLAARNTTMDQKEAIIKNYKGETKQELLALIRQKFPLAQGDRRAQNSVEHTLSQLRRMQKELGTHSFRPSPQQKKQIQEVLQFIQNLLDQ